MCIRENIHKASIIILIYFLMANLFQNSLFVCLTFDVPVITSCAGISCMIVRCHCVMYRVGNYLLGGQNYVPRTDVPWCLRFPVLMFPGTCDPLIRCFLCCFTSTVVIRKPFANFIFQVHTRSRIGLD